MNNKIKERPKAIVNLKNLKNLNVGGNNNINIDAICNVATLERLLINDCAKKAFRLPVDLACLHNLKGLFADVGDAGFANPEVIGTLEHLEGIVIHWQYLLSRSDKYIPEIKEMKGLKYLKINGSGRIDKPTKQKLQAEYPHCHIVFQR